PPRTGSPKSRARRRKQGAARTLSLNLPRRDPPSRARGRAIMGPAVALLPPQSGRAAPGRAPRDAPETRLPTKRKRVDHEDVTPSSSTRDDPVVPGVRFQPNSGGLYGVSATGELGGSTQRSGGDVRLPSESGQEVKRHGRLLFIKKRGVRRPALRELIRPISTPAETRLFSELYSRHSTKSSTNWINMCHEWNQRAALTVSQISGPDNAIHQKNIPLLKKYEKGLVKDFIRKDSLNALIAHNPGSLQQPNYAPSTSINPFVGGIHPYPPTFAHNIPFAPSAYPPFATLPMEGGVAHPIFFQPPLTDTRFQLQSGQSFPARPSKNNIEVEKVSKSTVESGLVAAYQ
ncbi:hypothetical protein KFL_000860200, partial [Klebsormidium nitens]